MSNNPKWRIAAMQSLADLKDTSLAAKAYLVRRLWRSTDPEMRQAARVALNMFKKEPRGSKGIAVARLVQAEVEKLRSDGGKRSSLKAAYGVVVEQTGLSLRTVKEYFEEHRTMIPLIEAQEQEALRRRLEAEAKAERDEVFFRGAAKWGPEE